MKTEEQLREEAKTLIKDIDVTPSIIKDLTNPPPPPPPQEEEEEDLMEVVELVSKAQILAKFRALSQEEREYLISLLGPKFKALRIAKEVDNLTEEEKDELSSSLLAAKEDGGFIDKYGPSMGTIAFCMVVYKLLSDKN